MRLTSALTMAALLASVVAIAVSSGSTSAPVLGSEVFVTAQSWLNSWEAITNRISNVISGIAGGLAMIMIGLAGLKYITAHGNRSAIADAKEAMVYAAIGFGIALSAQILRQLLQSIFG